MQIQFSRVAFQPFFKRAMEVRSCFGHRVEQVPDLTCWAVNHTNSKFVGLAGQDHGNTWDCKTPVIKFRAISGSDLTQRAGQPFHNDTGIPSFGDKIDFSSALHDLWGVKVKQNLGKQPFHQLANKTKQHNNIIIGHVFFKSGVVLRLESWLRML